MRTAMSKITVLAPDYEAARPALVSLAPRRSAVPPNAVLTLIENGKPNARALLGAIGEELRERLPLSRVEVHSKPSAGKPIEAGEAAAFAARSHFVIAGVGD